MYFSPRKSSWATNYHHRSHDHKSITIKTSTTTSRASLALHKHQPESDEGSPNSLPLHSASSWEPPTFLKIIKNRIFLDIFFRNSIFNYILFNSLVYPIQSDLDISTYLWVWWKKSIWNSLFSLRISSFSSISSRLIFLQSVLTSAFSNVLVVLSPSFKNEIFSEDVTPSPFSPFLSRTTVGFALDSFLVEIISLWHMNDMS